MRNIVRFIGENVFLIIGSVVAIGAAYLFVNTWRSPGPTSDQTNAVAQKYDFATQPSWEQDFSKQGDGPIDPKTWQYDLDPNVPGYNNEQQGYTDSQDNVRIENGTLVIEARKEAHQYPNDPQNRTFSYTSARIDTKRSFNFTYGKLEAVMKLPEGRGPWPAFWLLSAKNAYTKRLKPTEKNWAEPRFYLHDGEIDVMEALGTKTCSIEHTVHSFEKSSSSGSSVPDCSSAFNKYAMEWTPEYITFSVNDKPTYTLYKSSDNPDEWPFDQPMYIILNLAMGGEMGGSIDDAKAPWRMEVERISYFPLSK